MREWAERYLLPVGVFPPIPGDVLDFFRETEESILILFLNLFATHQSEEGVWEVMAETYTDTDWANHTYAEQREIQSSYESRINEICDLYQLFLVRAEYTLQFLKGRGPLIEASGFDLVMWDRYSYLMTVEFFEAPKQIYLPVGETNALFRSIE